MSFGSNNSANKFKKTYVKDFIHCDGKVIANESLQSNNLISLSGGNLNIGTDSNTSSIYIGNNNSSIYLNGTTSYVNSTNLEVKDNIILINKDGINCGNSGIEIEENGVIESFIKISDDKQNFKIKYPFNNDTYDMITKKNLESNISSIDSHIIQSGGCEDDYQISQNLLVGGKITTPSIYCKNLYSNQPFNKFIGKIIVNNFEIPLYKSILDSSIKIYTNLNLNSLILNTSIKIYLYPYTKVKLNGSIISKLFFNPKDDIYYEEYYINFTVLSIHCYYKNILI